MDSIPSTRKEALRIGSMFYNTGKPCKRGHTADRYAKKGTCKECAPILDAQDHYKEKRNLRMRSWRMGKSQQVKNYARAVVGEHVRTGRLIPQPCEVCGTDKKMQAHHDDYNMPLAVNWLCPKHHKERHLTLIAKFPHIGEK